MRRYANAERSGVCVSAVTADTHHVHTQTHTDTQRHTQCPHTDTHDVHTQTHTDTHRHGSERRSGFIPL